MTDHGDGSARREEMRVIYAEVSRWLVLGLYRIERLADRLFEGAEAVLHMMGWAGRPRPRGRFVDSRCS